MLYVGRSKNIHARWGNHHKLDCAKALCGARVHFRATRTPEAAERLEAIEINRHRPSLNGRRERIRKSTWCDAVDLASDIGVLLAIIFAVMLVFRAVQVISR